MIPWFRRFFQDEETFLKWSRRASLVLRSIALGLALGLMNGTVPWPAWVPPWLITLFGMIAGAIGVGQMNKTEGDSAER